MTSERLPYGWTMKSVGQLGDIKTGPFGTLLKANEYTAFDGVPLISVGEIGEGVLKVSEKTPRIPPRVVSRLPQYVLRSGDIVFGRKGSVDRSALISESQHGWFLGSDGIAVRPSAECHPPYLANQFQRSEVQAWLLQNATGTTMASLNQQVLRRVRVPVAPLTEQCEIADALAHVDDLQQKLDLLIAKKRDLKQAAMQQLLTGQVRLPGFSGELKTQRLGDLLSYEQPTQYLVRTSDYSDANEVPVLTAGKTFILGYTGESEGIVRDLPVIIFDDFTTATKYVTFPFKAKSSAMKLLRLRDPSLNLRVVYEVMQLIEFKLGDHKRYWISEYQHLEVKAPEAAEQAAIGAVLSDMDAEIAALEARRDKTRAVKQGMMRELLTGSIRLI